MHEWKKTGIAAAFADVKLEVEALEFLRQHSSRQPFDPFIEISNKNARPGKIFVKVSSGQQASYLMSSFEIIGSHVDVEHVQCSARRLQICPDTASSFASIPGDVHVSGFENRPAGEDGVPVWPAGAVSR